MGYEFMTKKKAEKTYLFEYLCDDAPESYTIIRNLEKQAYKAGLKEGKAHLAAANQRIEKLEKINEQLRNSIYVAVDLSWLNQEDK